MSITDSGSVSGSGSVGPSNLPYDGQLFRAQNRLFTETIVFVHHFGGNKNSFAKHIQFVNELGFDAVSFNLALHDAKFPLGFFPFSLKRFGLRYAWEKQIRKALDDLPGKKILYAFSMPAGAAFLATVNRKDIQALICDGGPFLDVGECVYNLFCLVYPVPTRLLRASATAISIGLLGAHWPREVPKLLAALPDQFPVLSFRGRHDKLVPTTAIEQFFIHGPRLNLERAAIDGGHLDGFRKDPSYQKILQQFLMRTATHADEI